MATSRKGGRHLRVCLPIVLNLMTTSCNAVQSASYTNDFWREKYTAVPKGGFIPVRTTFSPAPVSGIVKANGPHFTLNGQKFYFSGTNAYYLVMPDLTEYTEIETFFKVSADQGVNVVRSWGFADGYGADSIPLTQPIQPKLGVYNELALKQMDKVVATAGQNGIRLIIPFVNFWKEFGGMQFYVDEAVGKGQPQDLFFTNPAVKTAFKNYMRTILTRRNTITSVMYKDDPAIFAWELANEPHTADGYDNSGKIVKAWVNEMAGFIKNLDPNHMVATGEEGYKTGGSNDRAAWLDNGLKGVDFEGNTASPFIDFATIHVYPSHWGFEADDFWLGENFIKDRARIAHGLNKPVILEEIGSETTYTPGGREKFLRTYFAYANNADVAATLVWQIYAWPVEDYNTFNFDWTGSGSRAVKSQVQIMADKTAGRWTPGPIPNPDTPEPPSPPPAPSPPPDACSDVRPPGAGDFSCSEQAQWGKCKSAWMQGYCRKSCKSCDKPAGPGGEPSGPGPSPGGVPAPIPTPPGSSGGTCTDVSPPGNYTCQQQAVAWGKCNETWMRKYCDQSCGRCTGPKACTDVAPPGNYTCAQQVAFGKCTAAWMKGYCDQSCGRCEGVAPPCTDVAPTTDYTCKQQALQFNKCKETWMKGFCLKSCGKCAAASEGPPGVGPPAPSPPEGVPAPPQGAPAPPGTPPVVGGPPDDGSCTDVEPPGGYSCQVQGIIWGKCKESWMKGYCDQTCGRCPGKAAPCTDLKPPGQEHSCSQQAIWGKCNETWIQGYCDLTCGRCPGVEAPCTDVSPSSDYTCEDQAVRFKKCGEPWMKGFCAKSCGTCKGAVPGPPGVPTGPPPSSPPGVPAGPPPFPPPGVPAGPPPMYTSPPPAPVAAPPPPGIVPTFPPPGPVPVAPPPEADCPDVAPAGSPYSCVQQKQWGKCEEGWMSGFCLKSCGKCNSGGPSACADVAPTGSSYSCQQQKAWGKCNEGWLSGFCLKSCGKCDSSGGTGVGGGSAGDCTDIAPSGSSYSCAQQKDWGKCNEGWMSGFCLKSCGKCNSSGGSGGGSAGGCSDIAPPGSTYSCAQQKEWGKCQEGWMAGYCQQTCGKCAANVVRIPKPILLGT